MKRFTFWFSVCAVVAFTTGAGADVASYYCGGQRTASGQAYNPSGMTAAHRTLPFGTRVRVSRAGRSVELCINDRGPFVRGRTIDVSCGAGRALGLTGPGVAPVRVDVLHRGSGRRGNVC